MSASSNDSDQNGARAGQGGTPSVNRPDDPASGRPYSQDWQPIAAAPKDGSTILLRQGKWAPVHAYWHGAEWRYIEYDHPARPTHWAPVSEFQQSKPSGE